jgi:mono/diheme cytochrome c family protein
MSETARDEQGLALYTLLKILIVLMATGAGLHAATARGREERPGGSRPARHRPASGGSSASAMASATPPAEARAAGDLYRRYCQRCHEPDGTGQRDRLPEIPNFGDRAWHRSRNDFELAASILDGKGTRMPAFSERLDERQVRHLVAYLRGLGPDGRNSSTPAASRAAEDFEARYRQLKKELDDLQKQFNELSGR